jgi:hypothetical protein
VSSLEKHYIAFVTLILGLGFIFYSWFSSYPLSIDYPGDITFNHISAFYWIGFPLTLTSLFILGTSTKNHAFRSVICVASVAVIFSLSYFYSSLPTSDSQYFRGLTEYFIRTKNLDPSQSVHSYFQWPSFFLIGSIITNVSGLQLPTVEFILYFALGSVIAISLYVYASRLFGKGAILALIAFFISMYYFINYQWAPFTLALALLFILFMLETRKKSKPVILTMITLFLCLSITHFFAAVFFVFYTFARSVVDRTKEYLTQFFMTLTVYLLTQFTLGSFWIASNINNLFRLPSEYTAIAQSAFNPVTLPLDAIAQTASRTVTIVVGIVCLGGVILMLIKRRFRNVDLAIFISGSAYLAVGFVLYVLGNRGYSILFIPVSLGAGCLLETKLRPYLKGLFLILLILFVGVPIHISHSSYYGSFIPFQAEQESAVAHFLLDNYNWTSQSVVLAHASLTPYLQSNLVAEKTNAYFETEFWLDFPTLRKYDCIVFTVGLVSSFMGANYTVEDIFSEDRFDLYYNNGFSEVAVKSLPTT